MYVVLILLFLFLVCDGIRAQRSLRKAMGIKQPVGKVRKIGKAIRKAVKAAARECRETREYTREFHREMREARWEAQEERLEQEKAESVREVQAKQEPLDYESLSNRDLVDDLERDARTAAMAANVPTIEFPEEDDKYFSARKYESVDD